MKIAVFGGTFDPIHFGHLLIAEAAREAAALGRVIFLPAFHSPHKASVFASARERLTMTRMAVRGNPAFRVSDWEIRQERPVYTYEALAHFAQVFPGARLHFIMGSDALRDIRSWRHGAALLRQASFLIIERAEAPWLSLPLALRRQARRIPCPMVPFASHALRRRVREGKSIRYQVPEPVARHISRRRLYRQMNAA